MKKWLIAFGGFLLAVALAILGRDGRRAKKTEQQRDEMLGTGIKADQDKAEKLNKRAEKHKAAADRAAAKTIEKLEVLREKDHDMDDLLSAWQSERVRQQSDRPT
jgi:hypothetical protein